MNKNKSLEPVPVILQQLEENAPWSAMGRFAFLDTVLGPHIVVDDPQFPHRPDDLVEKAELDAVLFETLQEAPNDFAIAQLAMNDDQGELAIFLGARMEGHMPALDAEDTAAGATGGILQVGRHHIAGLALDTANVVQALGRHVQMRMLSNEAERHNCRTARRGPLF